MTNYEKFKDVINESDGMFGVRKGVAVSCHTKANDFPCTECEFDMNKDCFPQRMKWCAEEYHEPELEPEKEESEKKHVDQMFLRTAHFYAIPFLNKLIDKDKDTATMAISAVMTGIIGSLSLDVDEIIKNLDENRDISEGVKKK